MQDRPSYSELLDAVQGFLERDLVPALEGTKKFHARVAANVIAIVSRELALEQGHLEAEWRRLDALLAPEPIPAEHGSFKERLVERNRELCQRIREGEADGGTFRREVVAYVRETVRDKLAVTNPKLLASEDGSTRS